MGRSDLDPTFSRRRKIIGVMGSGVDEHVELATVAGSTIAALGHHLLTGGGGGVMRSVSQAYAGSSKRQGVVLGVIRAETESSAAGRMPVRSYSPLGTPNEWVDIPVFTHLPHSAELGKEPTSRNHINVLTSDVVVALPGGPGTRTEVELALEYGWPLVFFDGGLKIDGRPPSELAVGRPLVREAANAQDLAACITELLGQ